MLLVLRQSPKKNLADRIVDDVVREMRYQRQQFSLFLNAGEIQEQRAKLISRARLALRENPQWRFPSDTHH